MPPAPQSDDPLIGRVLGGNYEVRRLVADGGMGRVYQGIDRKRNERVAIKVLHAQVAKDEVARARFEREFEISKSLPHDHIIAVHDFLFDEGVQSWFLSMEYLEGEELRSHLERDKTLAPARLVRMFSQMAIGLDEAHRRSFVHRDLKPENIFLCGTREGDHVKVLDFGSVRVNKGDVKKLTAMGTTIGTAFYMAPEQASGAQNLDGRADVFACGAIAYECLAGKRPFDGPNGPQVLMSILMNDPTPVSQLLAANGVELPPGVDDAIERALAKKADIRTKTVGQFATELGRGFGLDGDFTSWASTPVSELESRIAAGHARAMAGGPAPASKAMDDAFRATEEALPMGRMPEWPAESVPQPKPASSKLVPVVVGVCVVALAVAAFLFTR